MHGVCLLLGADKQLLKLQGGQLLSSSLFVKHLNNQELLSFWNIVKNTLVKGINLVVKEIKDTLMVCHTF